MLVTLHITDYSGQKLVKGYEYAIKPTMDDAEIGNLVADLESALKSKVQSIAKAYASYKK